MDEEYEIRTWIIAYFPPFYMPLFSAYGLAQKMFSPPSFIVGLGHVPISQGSKIFGPVAAW